MDINVINYYLSKAKKAKEDVKPVYNEVLKYTDNTYQIEDSANKSFTINEIDSIIPTSLDDLTSFLMNSMISRSSAWATVVMNKEMYRLLNGDEDDFTSNDDLIRLNKMLEDVSSITYTYLNQSNYYSEIAKALRECINIGTGAYRVSERNDPIVPFVFQYLPQDDLFYWEDTFGRPNYIFKYLREMNNVDIQLMFDGQAKKPSMLKDDNESTTDLLEVIYPSEKNPHNFTYEVYTSDLKEKIYEIELEYCPIIIFRWRKEGSNPNGLGLSIYGLKAFKELKEAKEKRAESADKLLNPPLQITGNRALAERISLKANATNYTGTATPLQGTTMSQQLAISPIQTVGTLLPLDQDIINLTNEIRQLYTSNPLGSVDDYKRRSATESQIRLNALRQKWSLSFELMERELLMPTFLTPLKILVKKKKIDFDVVNLDTSMIVYKNALSLSQESQKVEMVNAYINSALLTMQYGEKVGLNLSKTLIYIRENLGLPLEVAMTQKELEQLQVQAQAQQQEQEANIAQQQSNMLRQQEIDQEAQKMELRAEKQAMAQMGM